MDTVRASQSRLASIVPYDPKYLPAEHYMSANENPCNVPEEIQRDIRSAIRNCSFNRYPDPLANELRDLIAQANGLNRENILLGNGGDELLFNIALAWGGPGRTFLNLPPTFSVYEANAYLTGTNVVNIARDSEYNIDEQAVLDRVSQGDIDYIIVTSPNNPTGKIANETFLKKLLEATDALVMVDEAYFEFSRFTMRPYLEMHKNLVILRTFSKAFSLAGVRLGYILAHEDIIKEFIKVRQPYSVDAVSQEIGKAVFKKRALFEKEIEAIINQRKFLIDELRSIDQVTVFDSDSNYVLLRVPQADLVWEKLYEKGVLVRDFSHSPYLENCLRVSVGTKEENAVFLTELRQILGA